MQPVHFIDDISRIAGETFPKNIAVRTRYDESLWAVESDPIQLHQVLLNLCVNARDAMLDGGTLTIAAENLRVDENYATMSPGLTPGPYVMMEVTDTGSGIPQDIIGKIFDPFFTTKEVGKGTGLGLSTAQGIVKSHGGVIAATSAPGGGTTFQVFLPAHEHSDPAAVSADTITASARGRGEMILVVDDELAIRDVIEKMLTKHNYRVLVAADGPQALALFAPRMDEIEAVLTDLAMPQMDGLMLARILKTMKPDLCVIASTGRLDDPRIRELHSAGVETCLNKPYTIGALLTTLERILRPEPTESEMCSSDLIVDEHKGLRPILIPAG